MFWKSVVKSLLVLVCMFGILCLAALFMPVFMGVIGWFAALTFWCRIGILAMIFVILIFVVYNLIKK